jgi:AhpD family alkylhydroperoxidase
MARNQPDADCASAGKKKQSSRNSERGKDADMMLDWNDYRGQLAAGVKEIGQLSPDTIKGYMALSGAGQKADLLDAKVRELIALAVAVTLRCDGCITVHTEAAIKHGAAKEEIAEALGVATSVNAGAALVYSARVMDAFKQYPRAASLREPNSSANRGG